MIRQFIILIILFFPISVAAQDSLHVVILHTNDMHSRIEPMPANDSKNPDKGGFIRQASFIEKVRKEYPIVFVFNSGDIVQGTPYFNLFKGEAEIAVMNEIKYDAACLGNHEFDYGLNTLATIISHAQFPFIASNFDFKETPLNGLTKEYLIIKRGGLKIGLIGLSMDPEGLIIEKNHEGVKYLPPVETANKLSSFLKEKEKCDIIICLSHLGYYPAENEMGDITLAKQSRYIDVILGGHSHTFLQKPDKRLNLDGKEVVISQMGKNATNIGRLDIYLKKK